MLSRIGYFTKIRKMKNYFNMINERYEFYKKEIKNLSILIEKVLIFYHDEILHEKNVLLQIYLQGRIDGVDEIYQYVKSYYNIMPLTISCLGTFSDSLSESRKRSGIT